MKRNTFHLFCFRSETWLSLDFCTRVIWIKDEAVVGGDADEEQDQVAVDIDVPFIVLHAITRDRDSYPLPCVYCQLSDGDDFSNMLGTGGDDGGDDDEGEEEEPQEDELFIVPEDDAALTKIFNALSHAALMNPDPPEDGAQEGDDEFIYDEDEVALGAEQARVLQHLESVFVAPSLVQQEAGVDADEDDDEEEDDDDDQAQFEDADEG